VSQLADPALGHAGQHGVPLPGRFAGAAGLLGGVWLWFQAAQLPGSASGRGEPAGAGAR
jgi:hypothetical protein